IAGVKDISDIKARYHGSSVLVDVVIHVDPKLNVVESHTITEKIEARMRKVHKISVVHIHIEPEQRIAER
ncbi:cation transporter dimerization domain-containing protein, partial [Bacillus sp. SIMBA_074]